MGDKMRTIQNLEIIKSDPENSLIFIKGSIPGSKNSLVLIQKTSKQIKKATTLENISKKEKSISTMGDKKKPAGKSSKPQETQKKIEEKKKPEVKKGK